MFGSKFAQSQASSRRAPYRRSQAPRRPVGRGVGGRIVVLRLADTIRCGADIIPCVYVRMIRILITRVLSLVPVNSALCAHYS